MKKYIILLFTLYLLVSCEIDNICIDQTTPHLIIRFYDKSNTANFKKVTNLKLTFENSLNEIVQVDAISTTDSISLPLNVDLDYTKIYLAKNVNETSDGVQDEFQVNYNRDEVFVSRSCGFKTIYTNVSITDVTNNWAENIAIIHTSIEKENEAHLNIFH